MQGASAACICTDRPRCVHIAQTRRTEDFSFIGKLFYRLLRQAVAVRPAPYESLVRYDCATAGNRSVNSSR
jgi:hypothetical protein